MCVSLVMIEIVILSELRYVFLQINSPSCIDSAVMSV